MHRAWRILLTGMLLSLATVLYLVPLTAQLLAALLVVLLAARLFFYHKDRYIPNFYRRDIRVYDEHYQAFIRNTLEDIRRCRIPGHTLLYEASRLGFSRTTRGEPLLLDLGVWIGWSTRLVSDATGLKVYGFDSFSGLVEDWQFEGKVVKRGSFSVRGREGEAAMKDTGVEFEEGLPSANGRNVEFIKGSTYDTLKPFLDARPDAEVRLFHMDLDTYESCHHALETCRDRFVEGSILVFDEYLVTNGEMRAFYEFQQKYGLRWKYRAWGLEIMEMNVEMTISPPKRVFNYLVTIATFWGLGAGKQFWMVFLKDFWNFWLSAPLGDVWFMVAAAGQRKSVSIEILDLGKLAD